MLTEDTIKSVLKKPRVYPAAILPKLKIVLIDWLGGLTTEDCAALSAHFYTTGYERGKAHLEPEHFDVPPAAAVVTRTRTDWFFEWGLNCQIQKHDVTSATSILVQWDTTDRAVPNYSDEEVQAFWDGYTKGVRPSGLVITVPVP